MSNHAVLKEYIPVSIQVQVKYSIVAIVSLSNYNVQYNT